MSSLITSEVDQLTEADYMDFLDDLDDFPTACEKYLKIKTEEGDILPFVLNELQLYVWEIMKSKLDAGVKIRLIILKCRQTGISTMIEAYLFLESVRDAFQKMLILGHETKSSANLYDMFVRYYNYFPAPMRPPIATNQNERKLKYAKLENEIDVQTAGANVDSQKAGTGRSSTYQYIHATECLSGDSLVILSGGESKKIKDVCIGDEVIVSNGELAKVNKVMDNGVKDTITIQTYYSNEPIDVTPDHMILTKEGWRKACELTNNDYINVPKIKFSNKTKTTETEYNNFKPTKNRPGGSKAKDSYKIKLNYDWGYVIGYYLAEGHIKKGIDRITFAYHQEETYINKIIRTIGGVPRTNFRANSKTATTTFYDKTLAKLIFEIAGRTEEKHVPNFIYDTNKRFAKGIIDGFFAGDGCKTKTTVSNGKYQINRATFVNTNEKVMRQIRRLLVSLDYGVASLRVSKASRYGKKTKDRYDLDLFGVGAAKLLKDNGGTVAKKSRVNKLKYIKHNGGHFVKVRSIADSIPQRVYDLSIDHELHNFETTIGTVHNCAFYPDYTTTFLGLLQASKKAKMIVLETTANGFNDFRSEWYDAKAGLTDYEPIFLSWTDFKTYTKPFDNDETRDILLKTLGSNPRYNEFVDEEKQLVEDHNCTLEQLNWRRWAINNLCKGKVQSFHQEYPTTDNEAFISTGAAFFPKTIVNHNYNDSYPPWKVGDLVYTYDGNKEINGTKFIENPSGYVKLHYKFKPSENDAYRFVAGTDVSEGLEQGDRSIIKVLDRKTMNVCITWSPSIHPDLLGVEQHKIWLFLKKQCYFNTERNNHGLTTITRSYALRVPQYYQQNFDKGHIETDTTKLGYWQTESSRRYLVDSLQEAVREESFADTEQEAWSEAMTFVRNSKGKVQAQNKDKDPNSKCFDDRIFAWGLMWLCHLWLPSYRLRKEQPVNPAWAEHIERRKKRPEYTGETIMSV